MDATPHLYMDATLPHMITPTFYIVTFPNAPEGRVAGHGSHGLQTVRHQQSGGAHPCRGVGRLCARVPAPYHHHTVTVVERRPRRS